MRTAVARAPPAVPMIVHAGGDVKRNLRCLLLIRRCSICSLPVFVACLFTMKQLIYSALFLSLAASALAVNRSDLDFRIRKLTLRLEEMQAKPDKRIPADALRRAQGVIILHRIKAGIGFAYQGGDGIMMVRDSSGQWSSPAFVGAHQGSVGFQIGGQESFSVILLMNTNTFAPVIEGSFDFAGEASGTAGNASSGVQGAIGGPEPLVRIYSDTSGLYGGVSLKAGSISPDSNANIAYYGDYLATNEILFGHRGKPTDAAVQLIQKLDGYSNSK